MGFPLEYKLKAGPEHWRPTSTIAQQQAPLLPDWGKTRTFAMPMRRDLRPAAAAALQRRQGLRLLQRGARGRRRRRPSDARAEGDRALLVRRRRCCRRRRPATGSRSRSSSPTSSKLPIDKRVDLLVRLGVATADAFIGCWQTKFEYETVRPVTYIRANIDPNFDAAPHHAAFPGISERAQHAVGRRGGGADAVLRREFRLTKTPRTSATACRRADSRAFGRRPRRRRCPGSTAASISAPRSSAGSIRAAASAATPTR